MTRKDVNNWIMYHEIHRLSILGFKAGRIARYLGVDRRTVARKLAMSEQEFEQFLLNQQDRVKKLDAYEDFVKAKLEAFNDTPSAQMFDWLKENFPDLPSVCGRTVLNFVMYVRQKHNIPVVPSQREYFPVEELPFGLQAQVDFGVYNMLCAHGRRKKVWLFAMVLSRSRYKFVWFTDSAFTTEAVCRFHEKAFEYLGGVTKVVVFDQDRTMMVDENLGDLLLTAGFAEYVKARGFRAHFCRKADPESKGKVERVIQYVKKNFLYNRTYTDMESLNEQAMAWLGRTANYLEHHVTKISPVEAFYTEQLHLAPFKPVLMEREDQTQYLVRKDHTLNYRSNFYSVPAGTYQGPNTYVLVKEQEGRLEISHPGGKHICTHDIPAGAGNKVINSNHKRDHSISIGLLMTRTSELFTDKQKAFEYLDQIRKAYPRYIRDQIQAIHKAVTSADSQVTDKALAFCVKNQVFNAADFERVHAVIALEHGKPEPVTGPIRLLDAKNLQKAQQMPGQHTLDDYEHLFNN